MRRLPPLWVALACVAACVPVRPGPSSGGGLVTTADRKGSSAEVQRYFSSQPAPGTVERVENIHYFDLASCASPRTPLTEPFGDEELLAALALARPQLYECLVDPLHRGHAVETRVAITATASAGDGVQHAVSGTNLTRSGERCLLETTIAVLSGLPSLPEGWPPAKAMLELVHTPGTLPTVLPKGNELSEAAGEIRLAMASFCPCFQPWDDAPPAIVDATVTLRPLAEPGRTVMPGPPYRVSVARVPAGAEEVASCLKGRLEQMKFNPPRTELRIPYLFAFIDSRHDGPLDGLPDWLQHKQMESVRNRRFAETTMALGVRSSAARNYNALVERYSKDRSVKVAVLSQACGALVAADDRWASALKRKLEVEQLTKNAEHIAKTEESLRTAQQVRTTDERACPRTLQPKERPAPEVIQVTPFKP